MSDAARDATVALRDGDAVSAPPLLAWLNAQNALRFPAHATLKPSQFPAGFSNLTYLVRVEADGDVTEYVLRRPPRGARAGNAHNMAREYGILAAVHPLGVPVPAPVVCCEDEKVIGAPFYIMERVRGVILRGRTPNSIKLDAPVLARLSATFVETLAQLHAVPVNSGKLSKLGRPEGYVLRQVQGWTTRWHASRTENVSEMEDVAAWLATNRPPEAGAALIHNDFKFDNLVLDPDDLSRVVAILDWEMATIGDPLMDLGTSLAYWVDASDSPEFQSLGLGITSLPGNATRSELVRAYGTMTGRDVSNAPFYYAFGLFKVAVIAQQIYARHLQGMTSDPRFGALNKTVQAMGEAALRVATQQVI